MHDLSAPYRADLTDAGHVNGQPVMTNLRRITADSGSAFVTAATAALGLLAAGLLYVSFAAQYAYILREKPGQRLASVIEALMLDAGMIIFSFLALGLAKKGLSSRAERTLIMVCAGLSAWMNYAASNTASWRSVAVYVVAPVFLAVVTDRVIAAVRRHVLGPGETSAWATLGRGLATTARIAGMVLLYLLRFVFAFPSTFFGLRRLLLAATPLPEAGLRREITRGAASPPGRPGAAGAAEAPDPADVPRLAALQAPVLEPAAAGPDGRVHPGVAAGGHAPPPGRPPRPGGRRPAGRRSGSEPVTDEAIEAHYAAKLNAGGQVPSRKTIRRQWSIGSVRADQIYIRLTARRLAHLPAGEIPAAVAALPAEDIGKVREILGAVVAADGTGFGPNAATAHKACTAALAG
jgi:hypothetical protein